MAQDKEIFMTASAPITHSRRTTGQKAPTASRPFALLRASLRAA